MIVDEEQRFGVAQKELLRSLRLEVDVLALTATPIPRTLHMSLVRSARHLDHRDAARGPAADPDDVGEYDEELIKTALEREHERGGQSFYLHNRVETIEEAAEKLQQLCPGAALPRRARADAGARARGANARVPARRRRRARLDDDHRVGPRHPAGEHARSSSAPTCSGSPSSTRSAGASAAPTSPPTRTSSIPTRSELTAGGARPARDARRPHRARRRLRDRDARPRDPRRRRAARRRAVGARRRASASSSTSSCSTRRSRSSPASGAPRARPVRVDARIDAYVPAGYIASEALKIDLHRRLALAETEDELRELQRGDRGPLRAAARAGREPLRDPGGEAEARARSAPTTSSSAAASATVGPLVLGSERAARAPRPGRHRGLHDGEA